MIDEVFTPDSPSHGKINQRHAHTQTKRNVSHKRPNDFVNHNGLLVDAFLEDSKSDDRKVSGSG